MVSINATGAVDTRHASNGHHLAHLVEQIVFDFAESFARRGQALLLEQIVSRFDFRTGRQDLAQVRGECLEFFVVRHGGAFALQFDHRGDVLGRVRVHGDPASARIAAQAGFLGP